MRPRPPVSGFSLFGDIHGKSEYNRIYNSFTVYVETAKMVWQDFYDKAFHTRDPDFINTISAITIEILY